MKEVIIEMIICLVAASVLMMIHETSKSLLYMAVRKDKTSVRRVSNIFKVWKYIDPVGLVLSVACYVPVSKPYMFRIRDKKTNKYLGICGFTVLLLCFAVGLSVLKMGYGGMTGIDKASAAGEVSNAMVLFWQYLAILSFDFMIVNLFPVSTFDMGLLIAGTSARHYLKIIKSDSVIKLIMLLTMMLDIIHYGCIRMLEVIL